MAGYGKRDEFYYDVVPDRRQYKFGWIPDYPDFRDYSEESEKVSGLLAPLKERAGMGSRMGAGMGTGVRAAKKADGSGGSRGNDDGSGSNGGSGTYRGGGSGSKLPAVVDLRKWCSSVEDQGNLGACTAHAVAGVVEYFENRTYGKYIDISRIFLYKVTRNILHYTGDTGAFLRSTIGAMVIFGSPPEEYCPYDTGSYDEEPSAFCYAFGQNYKLIQYYRHDQPNLTKPQILDSVKSHIAMGIPSVFGFTVYQSIAETKADGWIPFPEKNEKVVGGHAVAAVGYDDDAEAMLIRNSWGANWGMNGYGWLPYDYLLKGLAVDWWSIIKEDWVDTRMFAEA